MKTVDILKSKVSADELYVRSLAETQELMGMFADYLKQKRADDLSAAGLDDDAPHVTTVEFLANNHAGKSSTINALRVALGADDVHERFDPTGKGRHEQTLSRSEDFGWVRHYDAMLPAHFRLKASQDPDFWDTHKTGVDLSENSDSSVDFDFVVELAKVDREDRSPDAARRFMFFTDPGTFESDGFQNFMSAAKERFGTPHAPPAATSDATHG